MADKPKRIPWLKYLLGGFVFFFLLLHILSIIVAMVLLTGGPVERWCDTALRNQPRDPHA